MRTTGLALLCSLLLSPILGGSDLLAADQPAPTQPTAAEHHPADEVSHHNASGADEAHVADDHHGAHHAGPNPLAVIPFAVLLLCIAVCPLASPHFWHHHYPKVAIGLGLITGAYYLFALHDHISLVHVGFEYFSFISLLTGLFVAAGGIVININKKASPWLNVGLLGFGAVIANIIGTTGAAMLLIRTFMRINKGRLQPYHIIFFIFIVANVGGALTPIGDPPLFLGFLKGIEFFQFFELDFLPWVLGVTMLLATFLMIDMRNTAGSDATEIAVPGGGVQVQVAGGSSFAWLALVVGAVFLDPNKFEWLPCVTIIDHAHLGFGFGSDIDPTGQGGQVVEGFSFVREFIQISVAIAAYLSANKVNLEANGFNFEPIKEVGYLFIGIFLTMVPALALIKGWASDPQNAEFLTPTTLYFGTGLLSGVLDNAPTFLSFLAGLEGEVHMTAAQISQMIDWSMAVPVDTHPVALAYLQHLNEEAYFSPESISEAVHGLQQLASWIQAGQLDQAAVALKEHGLLMNPASIDVGRLQDSIGMLNEVPNSLLTAHAKDGDLIALSDELAACAVAAVFWGAFTYIGNGPNFMVKSIADSTLDENGNKVVECPSFFGYVIKYSVPFLLPMLLVVWLVFFSPWQFL